MAATQRPIAASALEDIATKAAWKTIPSWTMVTTQDLAIPPDSMRYMADRDRVHDRRDRRLRCRRRLQARRGRRPDPQGRPRHRPLTPRDGTAGPTRHRRTGGPQLDSPPFVAMSSSMSCPDHAAARDPAMLTPNFGQPWADATVGVGPADAATVRSAREALAGCRTWETRGLAAETKLDGIVVVFHQTGAIQNPGHVLFPCRPHRRSATSGVWHGRAVHRPASPSPAHGGCLSRECDESQWPAAGLALAIRSIMMSDLVGKVTGDHRSRRVSDTGGSQW